MNFVNLTPHPLSIRTESGDFLQLAKSNSPARVSSESTLVEVVDGVAFRRVVFGEVTDLPEPQAGTIFIVSALVRMASGRPDTASPGELLRDAEGRPVGADGLVLN